MHMREVIIIGAGLSGLTAAYSLHKEGIKPLLMEARDRTGGRVLTLVAEGSKTPVEMGATWFTDKHQYLLALLKELELSYYTQFQKGVGVFETSQSEEAQLFQIPTTVEPSYRIAGGTSMLTDALADHIGRAQLVLGSPLIQVSARNGHIEVKSGTGEVHSCRHLIITIPPFLIVSQKIAFDPELPPELAHVMRSTHTWMGEAIKFAVAYEKPFWRQQGYAGVVFSHEGIAREVHDHCSVEETHYALKGFLSADAFALSKKQREAEVIQQLTRLLGKEASVYLSYTEKVWQEEVFTYADYGKYIMPHQHNGHPLYARPLMSGRLYLAGTETSPHYGGYLEGAVYSGVSVAKKVLHSLGPFK
jgi:monoamine oxidase